MWVLEIECRTSFILARQVLYQLSYLPDLKVDFESHGEDVLVKEESMVYAKEWAYEIPLHQGSNLSENG